MAKLTPQEFQAKYNRLFDDNEIQNITEATFREWTLDMTDSFAGQNKGPNDTVGGVKLVIYQTRDEAVRAGRPANAALDQLDPLTVVAGNLARIDITPTGPVWLEAVWDDGKGPYPYGPGFLALLDGSGQLHKAQLPASGGLAATKWVRKDSPEALSANVALYKAGRDYRENDLVRGLFGTFPDVKSVVFYANESGTDIPAPSRPEGDAYWSVFNPTPAPYFPWQTVTPNELRKLQAGAKLTAGRLYIVSPRLILGSDGDQSYPDMFIRALMETELEATGWLLVGANDKQLVNYDLATDTTTPVATGGASTFAELAGAPRDNELLAAELDNYQLRVESARPFRVVAPNGATSYYNEWLDMAEAPAGSQIYLRGAYGNANTDYPFLNDHTLVLEPRSVFTGRRFFAHTSGGVPDAQGFKLRGIEGTGTLRGVVIWYGNAAIRLLIKNIRHEGRIEHNAYGGPENGVLGAKLSVYNVEAVAPDGQAYFTGFHRNGGFYTVWFQASFYQCRIKATNSPAFYLYSANNDATVDAAGKANNLLAVVGCVLTGDNSSSALSTTASGVATYQFGANFLVDMLLPSEAVADNFTPWGKAPAGGGPGADLSNYYTKEQDNTRLETVRATVRVTAPVSADRAIQATDAGAVIQCADAVTLTLPADVWPSDGTSSQVLEIAAYGVYVVQVVPGAGVTIIQAERKTDGTDGARLRLTQRSTNVWDLAGGVA